MPSCSVVICTLNPSLTTFPRVLAALRAQTLPLAEWELIVVDNGSSPPVSTWVDLTWQTQSRFVREMKPGLLAARIRGTRESKSPLIVFVDDDNLLDPTFLEEAVRLSAEHPRVGVWSGQSVPEFSAPPPDWTRAYWCLLAVAEFESDEISTHWTPELVLPIGAGMCVRRSLMEDYTRFCEENPARMLLGRRGGILMSSDDHDIALCAFELNYVTARFTSLRLTHVVPSFRLEAPYLLRLMTQMAASREVLASLHPDFSHGKPSPLPHWLRVLRHWLRLPGFERSRRLATLEGERLGRKALAEVKSISTPHPPF